jgi:hypothetical protein
VQAPVVLEEPLLAVGIVGYNNRHGKRCYSPQEEVLHGNPSERLVYCGLENWSDVGRWQGHVQQP